MTYAITCDGQALEHGDANTRAFPDAEKRRQLKAEGLRVTVDGKAYKENLKEADNA